MGNLLGEAELKKLATAITEVERTTSGELRLVIVGSSARTSHVFPLLSFVLASAGLLALWYLRAPILLEPVPFLAPLVLAASVLIAFVLSRSSVIRRRFTWPADLEHQVLMRAELEFHREGLDATKDKTGILIFLSVEEHQAVVLGDKGINEKLKPEVWSKVIATILEGARKKQLAQKLEEAIRTCGHLLHQHFPIQPGDKNELPNHVVVKP